MSICGRCLLTSLLRVTFERPQRARDRSILLFIHRFIVVTFLVSLLLISMYPGQDVCGVPNKPKNSFAGFVPVEAAHDC